MCRQLYLALREWLCTGIDVHWGKKFTRYEESPDGVTAYFEDGSCATGEILVGADSVQSQGAYIYLELSELWLTQYNVVSP